MLKNPYGKQKTKQEIQEIERNGHIGDLIDKLIGPKKVVKTKTCYEGGITSHTQKLVEIIEDEKAKIQSKNTQKMKNMKGLT